LNGAGLFHQHIAPSTLPCLLEYWRSSSDGAGGLAGTGAEKRQYGLAEQSPFDLKDR